MLVNTTLVLRRALILLVCSRVQTSYLFLAGGPCPPPPVKIFRRCQKLENGAKKCITSDARTSFVGRNSEFGKTEELFNSLGRLCFGEGGVVKTARAI